MKTKTFAAAALLAATPAYGQVWSDPWGATDFAVGASMGMYSNLIEKAYGEDQCFVGLWNAVFNGMRRSKLFNGSK